MNKVINPWSLAFSVLQYATTLYLNLTYQNLKGPSCCILVVILTVIVDQNV